MVCPISVKILQFINLYPSTTCPLGTPLYDSTRSSSFTGTSDTVTIRYGSGAVQGTIAQDTVSMGGFIAESQTFGSYLL